MTPLKIPLDSWSCLHDLELYQTFRHPLSGSIFLDTLGSHMLCFRSTIELCSSTIPLHFILVLLSQNPERNFVCNLQILELPCLYVNTHCSGQISLKIYIQVSSWPHNLLATMTLDDVGQFLFLPKSIKTFYVSQMYHFYSILNICIFPLCSQ